LEQVQLVAVAVVQAAVCDGSMICQLLQEKHSLYLWAQVADMDLLGRPLSNVAQMH
jgi:hypothetical protein